MEGWKEGGEEEREGGKEERGRKGEGRRKGVREEEWRGEIERIQQ